MTDLTPQQKNKLLRLASVADAGNLGIAEKVISLEDKIDTIVPEVETKLEQAISEVKASVPDMKSVLEQIKGKDGETGTTGERGSKFLGIFDTQDLLPSTESYQQGDFAVVDGTIWYIV